LATQNIKRISDTVDIRKIIGKTPRVDWEQSNKR